MDGEQRLQGAHGADHRAEDARFAAGQVAVGAGAVHAGVAGAVRTAQIKYRQLAVETDGGAAHQRFAVRHTGGIGGLAGGEVVAAVEHQIDVGHMPVQPFTVGAGGVGLDQHVRVERAQLRRQRPGLALAHLVAAKGDLPVQVAGVDPVIVHQQQPPHPGAGQIQRRRIGQAAAAHQ